MNSTLDYSETHVPAITDVPGKTDFPFVGIGASAGGIQALTEFFKNVPPDTGMAYLVILYLPPEHESQLAAQLQTVTEMPVVQLREKTVAKPDCIFVIPPDRHLLMADSYMAVLPVAIPEETRAPIDIFFRTLADLYGPKVICVVLSGAGANGSMGLKRIKERGGVAFVQNPREAEYKEMPRNAIATDLVDAVLPVAELPARIIAYKNNLGKVHLPVEASQQAEDEQQALQQVFTQLRLHTGHDFSNYKRPTLLRRIERRINVCNLPDVTAYAAFIIQHPDELTSLLKDLLISVTNFFRDKKAFGALEEEVIPRLFHEKPSQKPVRIWVAGSATGEEAYSVAMLCVEQREKRADAPKVQIFATDIDEAATNKAREGLYTLTDAADVSPERLRRFFTKEGDSYRACREIREMILFAHHNLIKDPPFSRLDLITCRNVLIYLNSTAQEKVIKTFHFALNPGGFLFLGNSETANGATDLYTILNREQNIYQSRQVATRTFPLMDTFPVTRQEPTESKLFKEAQSRGAERITFGDLHLRLLEQYAPPSMVVNEEYDIVHVSKQAGRYLQVSGGEPSRNLLKLIRQELRLTLRTVLYQATQQQQPVETRNLKVNVDTTTETINILVRPALQQDEAARGFLLVVFEPATADFSDPPLVLTSAEPAARQLEEELIRLKTQLRISNEQHEFQAEELKASNEELQAMNEELLSAAEELETSKEELQSINEELSTVNQELKIKMEEISTASNNLRNLINATDIGTVFLDRSLRVVLFTPAARSIFNLIDADHGRLLSDITNKIGNINILKDAEIVLDKLQTVEREMVNTNGNVFLMRILPYRVNQDRINGVIITFVDITARKQAEEHLQESLLRNTEILESISDAFYTIDANFNFTYINKVAEKWWGRSREELIGKHYWTEFPQAINSPSYQMHYKALKEQKEMRYETFSPILDRWINVALYPNQSGGLSCYFQDNTERRQAEEALRISEERYRIALQSAEMGAWDMDISTNEVVWNDQHYLMLGLTPNPEKLNAQYLMKFVHPDDVERLKKAFSNAIAKTGVYYEEFRIIRADNGTVRWMNSYGRIVINENDASKRIIGVIYDVTERKRLEQQKDDFIGIASHELKTPVTSIKVYTELLRNTFEKTEDTQKAVLAKKLNKQVDRLIDLIRNLLDTTKVAEGQLSLHLEPFEIDVLIAEQVEELQHQSNTHQIIIQPCDKAIITADRERIGQVLTNLLTNAIKYSPKGGEVRISCEIINDQLQISVRDEGVGIPEEMQKKVFERFFMIRTDEVQTYPGMGLGLYITAGIIHLHGGRIWLESKPGIGSVFKFALPLTISPSNIQHRVNQKTGSASEKKK